MPTRPKSDDNLNLEILNKTKGKLPSLPFSDIKDAVLGKHYNLSLVFVGDTTSRKLNRAYRNKDKPTNVLSFALSKDEGEMFINLKKARSELALFDEKFPNFIGFLFIHGLLHLKGLDHGSTMEREELKFRKKFQI